MRIASYNVRNLFDEASDLPSASLAKPEKERRALAGTLTALAADVVLLQEVGSLRVLAEINDSLAAPYPFVDLLEGNSDRGIHLAILSRDPFQLTSHRRLELQDEAGERLLEYESEAAARAGRSTPLRIQRDLMLAEVQLADEGVLALFNVHLKSKTNRDWRLLGADVVRAAEVRRITERIGSYLATHPERPLIVGGDFNDLRSSVVLEPLFALPLSDPMGEELAQTGRNPSTYWPKRRMRLDYLLLSPAAGRKLVSGSPAIHASQRAKRASDHYPVSLDLSFDT